MKKLLKLLAQLVSVFNDFVKERILYRSIPANIYLFKVSNRHTIKKSEICSKLTTKTPEDVINVIDTVLVLLLLTLNIFHTFF